MMTEQEKNVVECLMAFGRALMDNNDVEDIMYVFMRDARIAFSPEGKEQLEKHLKTLNNLKNVTQGN